MTSDAEARDVRPVKKVFFKPEKSIGDMTPEERHAWALAVFDKMLEARNRKPSPS